MEARYAASGWNVVSMKHGSPDLIIVRGCSVTAKAQRDCEKAIAHLRASFPGVKIRVTGCLPGAEKVPPQPPAPVPLRLSRAYLKVQDGCSGRCAFCIVPSFRGKPVSVPFADVLARARAFLDAGYRELVLSGCNLCLYRDSGRGLPELAAELAALDSPGHRVRLGSIEPGICDARLIGALAAHRNICRSIHLSLQSASDRILRLMRRPYSMAQVAEFCGEVRRMPGARVALGADIIAGFPGETDADFAASCDFVASTAQLVHLHVFPYSERPGTAAAEMKPAVPVAVRRARAKTLERLGAANRAAYAQALVGREVVVCVEKDGNGRTDDYFRCLLRGAAPRRSLARAVATEYFPKTGALSATIRAKEQKEEPYNVHA